MTSDSRRGEGEVGVARAHGDDHVAGRGHRLQTPDQRRVVREQFAGGAGRQQGVPQRVRMDRARRRSSEKHGGAWHRDDFTQALDVPAPEADNLPELDAALQELAQIHPRLAEVVELRYFLGLTVAEVAALRQMDERSIYRDWAVGRAWLRERLGSE